MIDGSRLHSDACWACNCGESCSAETTCYTKCAALIERELATAYLRSNIAGLGVYAPGYEAGLSAALLAIGLEPEATAEVDQRLTAPLEENSYLGSFWLRTDASLALLFITDEEDCSMPAALFPQLFNFEGAGRPYSSGCYDEAFGSWLLGVGAMAAMVNATKDCPQASVSVGLVGGVRSVNGDQGPTWEASDISCATPPCSEVQRCSCFAPAPGPEFLQWCQYTSSSDLSLPACTALAGHRYVEFANAFAKHAFASLGLGYDGGLGRLGDLIADTSAPSSCELITGPGD